MELSPRSIGIGFSPQKRFIDPSRGSRVLGNEVAEIKKSGFLEEAPEDSIQFKSHLDFLPSYYNTRTKISTSNSSKSEGLANQGEQALRLIKQKAEKKYEEQKAMMSSTAQEKNMALAEPEGLLVFRNQKMSEGAETSASEPKIIQASRESELNPSVQRLIDFSDMDYLNQQDVYTSNNAPSKNFEFKNTQSQRNASSKVQTNNLNGQLYPLQNLNRSKHNEIGSQANLANLKKIKFGVNKRKAGPTTASQKTLVGMGGKKLKTNALPVMSRGASNNSSSVIVKQQQMAAAVEIHDDEIESDDNFENVNRSFRETMQITPISVKTDQFNISQLEDARLNSEQRNIEYSSSKINPKFTTNNSVEAKVLNRRKRFSDLIPMIEYEPKEKLPKNNCVIVCVEKITKNFGVIALEGTVENIEHCPFGISVGEKVVGMYSCVENRSSNFSIGLNSRWRWEFKFNSEKPLQTKNRVVLFIDALSEYK